MRLLSIGATNTKINKGARHTAGFLPFILHLALISNTVPLYVGLGIG